MKIDFSFETPHGVFRDALYLPDDHSFTSEQIMAMQKERLDNWVAVVENPPEPEYVEIDGMRYEEITLNGRVLLKPVGADNG